MADTRWTPGPWLVSETGSVVAASDSGYVAEPYDGRHTLQNDAAITAANAHLIAAAPEMYEALAAVIGDYEAHMRGHEYVPTPLIAARAALAKARGEQ